MKGITFRVRGSFNKTENFLDYLRKLSFPYRLHKYAQQGVEMLASATPKDTGNTAESWGYEIEKTDNGYSIYWTNKNINDGVNIALILQYGHGTRNGGFVQGRDYINPAIRPIFDKMSEEAWADLKQH